MGYVEGLYGNQSLEEVAEEYVLCLLNRGFFYFNDRYRLDGCTYLQMHNLMHDLVLSIGGLKYKMADSNTNEFDERVCHVSFHLEDGSSLKVPSSLFKIKQLQSFLLPLPSDRHFYKEQVRVFPSNETSIFRIESLRVLRIHGLGINKLPKSVGKLIHLRYLDFSHNSIRKLPESITQLVNLYLLNLSCCRSLEELPEDINKLVMLRHLDLSGCFNLSHLPKGLGKLTGLETLYYFVVGKPRTSVTPYGSKAKLGCDLADLGYLNNLKGVLKIVVDDRSKDIVSEAKAANLDSKGIEFLDISFRESRLEDEMVVENLKPGADLEYLYIKNYGGKRLPSWMRESIHCWLPNLVEIQIVECKECINMCSFGRLPHLQTLYLWRLDKVEYIENGSSNKSNMVLVANERPSTPLFPSLTYLSLSGIPELKGWWSMTECAQDQSQNQLLNHHMPAFPKLKYVRMDMELVISLAKEFLQRISSLEDLTIEKCPRLKSLPHEMSNLSNLKTLYITECSRELAERCQSPSGEDWPKIQHIRYITIKPVKNGEE